MTLPSGGNFQPGCRGQPASIGDGTFAGIAFGQYLITPGQEPAQIGIVAKAGIQANEGALPLGPGERQQPL